ncbi:MAG: hypothetical protein JO011_12185 [Ktedonobacteraceae bacterium]|nr:hypothetical protein [Ktedonobacteraceae bacterium]
MPEIHLDHVLFARVERPYSPKGTSGYQVVYQSPALGPETAQIERQIQCFQINRQQMVRHQFFWTASGQAVCTRTVSLISPDREVVDRDQRDAFLVHALVLSQADFARVRNDPFALFAAAEQRQVLAGQVSQLVQYLRVAPPPDSLYVPTRTQTSYPLDGSQEELLQLYRLVEAAPTLTGQKQSIQMIAPNPGDIFRLLSSLLIMLPSDERVACTFDTFADSCSPIPGSFWTIGSTRPLSQTGFLSMRLAERQIVSVRPVSNDSLYTTWFLYALQNLGTFAQLNEDLFTAQLIAESFKAGKALPNQLLSERALSTFHRLNDQSIDACFVKALASVMEKRLAEAFAPSLFTALPLPAVLNIAATGDCEIQFLAGMMYNWFFQVQPDWKEWDDVLDVAIHADFAPLLLLASLKAHPRLFKNYGKLQLQAIQTLLDSNLLPQVLTNLCGSAPPASVSSAINSEPLPGQSVLNDEEFQALVLALLQQKAGRLLQAPCVQRVGLLQQRKIVLNLAKATANQDVVPEFVAALQQHPLYDK